MHNYQDVLKRCIDKLNGYNERFVIDGNGQVGSGSGFFLYRLADLVPKTNIIIPPSRSSAYMITFVEKGAGENTVGDFNFPIKENTLIIAPYGVLQSSELWPSDWSGYCLLFSIDFFLNINFLKEAITHKKVFKKAVQPYLYADKCQANAISEIFESIISESQLNEQAQQTMVGIKILELLIYCDRFFLAANLIYED